MTNQEILEKAIQKAIDNKWGMFGFVDRYYIDWIVDWPTRTFRIRTRISKNGYDFEGYDVYRLIFNHELAKALWGDTNIEVYGGLWTRGMPKPTTIELHHVPAYLHQLQQMVISDDPIRYLGKHI